MRQVLVVLACIIVVPSCAFADAYATTENRKRVPLKATAWTGAEEQQRKSVCAGTVDGPTGGHSRCSRVRSARLSGRMINERVFVTAVRSIRRLREQRNGGVKWQGDAAG